MKAALMMENNADLVIRDDVTLGDVGPKDVRVKIGGARSVTRNCSPT